MRFEKKISEPMENFWANPNYIPRYISNTFVNFPINLSDTLQEKLFMEFIFAQKTFLRLWMIWGLYYKLYLKLYRTLQTEADRHCRDWEAEVKAHSVTKSGLLQIEKENEDQRKTIDDMTAKLSRALEERKTFKTKYERMKKVKSNLDRRAESYR